MYGTVLFGAGQPRCKGPRRNQPQHGETNAANIRRRPAADIYVDATRLIPTFPRVRNLQAVVTVTPLPFCTKKQLKSRLDDDA